MEVPEEEDSKESLYDQEQEELKVELLEEDPQQQRPVARSLDEQLCRGELPPLNPIPTLSSHNSPLPNAASSPHTKLHSRTSSHNNTQSPSSSTLKLMKKQITEIEREIAMRRPDGGPRRGGHDGEGPHPPLDLHLLDPLSKYFVTYEYIFFVFLLRITKAFICAGTFLGVFALIYIFSSTEICFSG